MHGVKKRVMQVLQHLKDFRIMYDYNKRLSTFTDWPFTENCKCTPENMAKAGFVHCPTENEPDVACCFFCLKELEGWEPDDDPMTEHSKRSVTCGFLSLTKNTDDLTMEEFLRLEVFRIKTFYVRKVLVPQCAQSSVLWVPPLESGLLLTMQGAD
ncbi:baculoviral IAP repeat-containing protein 5.1-like isoform X3 [Dendrobates tinctorius]|uniref:baculoviral IAP repeat-containing protein 5.1-like isoform X3 n=1 Tax=Dendrobates tinctorius TaxID=92724 RepID=UPI003CC9F599